MAGKITIYEKAEREIQKDRLWKAKEILQGNLKRFGYDKKLYEMYGKLLDRLGDKMEAGRYLFLSGKIKAEDSDSISLYLKRHTKKDPRYLLRTFPKASQLKTIEEYPESVAEVLKELGLKDKDLYLKLPKPAEHKGTWFDKINLFDIPNKILIIWVILTVVGLFAILIY